MKYGRLLRLIVFFIWIASGVNCVFSQEVRVGDGEKTDSLGQTSGIVGLGEKVLDLVTWEKEGVVYTVYPSLSVSPRNGFVYGVMPAVKWNSAHEGRYNTLAINAEHSTKGMLQLQLEHEWYPGGKWLTTGEAFLNRREDHFWVGANDRDFFFDRKEFRIEWDLLNNPVPALWIGGGILLNNNRFEKSTTFVFEEEGLDGAEGGFIAGVGPKLVVDTRHRTLSPQKGMWLEILPLFAGVSGVGDYKYQRYILDARKYLTLKEEVTSLAFQVIIDFAEGDIPFYEEPQLGGKERLRGIGHPLEETGNAVWLARAEARQHLWWRLGVVAFAGAGKADNGYQKPFTDLISSVGGGFRFRMLPDDPLNVRFDFGVSSMGTTGFFISLKEAF